MAKVFADTNCFIALAHRAPEIESYYFDRHESYISVLSTHIYFYVDKKKVPSPADTAFIESFNLVTLDANITRKALIGPTDDLEDNIQLHCATAAETDFFVTFDKKLLKMRFFGKMQIVAPQNLP